MSIKIRMVAFLTLVLLLISQTFYMTGLADDQPDADKTAFSDLDSSFWAYNDIQYMIDAGRFNGYSNGTFQPAKTVTRGEFAKMLVLGLSLPMVTADKPSFKDVSTKNSYYKYIETVKKYLPGYVDSKTKSKSFKPTSYILREDAASAVVRVVKLDKEPVSLKILDKYKDKTKITSSLKNLVAIAVSKSLLNITKTGIEPKRAINRAEACVLLRNALKNLPSLSKTYKSYFDIGAAIGPNSVDTSKEFLTRQFSSLTAESVMKFKTLQPLEGKFDFTAADKIVNFAVSNNIKVRGHTLVWHSSIPDWLFVDSEKKEVSKEVLLKRMETHIKTVVNHFKGKVYCWDVVNEAVDEAQNSMWHKILGQEHIEKAFQFAHEADPNALLFYNDFNLDNQQKFEKVYNYIKGLKEKGVPIHGIGIQGHFKVGNFNIYALEDNINAFAELGLKVHITELDFSYYSPGKDDAVRYETPPIDVMENQDYKYKKLFGLLKKYKKNVTSVTFWGMNDGVSWLSNGNSGHGKPDWPLLFDKLNNPKSAFWNVIGF